MSDIADKVLDRALETVRGEAQIRARDYLCRNCLDQRCLTGSICKAFIKLTNSFAWEIIAKEAENN
jgi:hypothetical protein